MFSFDVVVAVASLDVRVPIDKPLLLTRASIYPLLESITWIPLKKLLGYKHCHFEDFKMILTLILRLGDLWFNKLVATCFIGSKIIRLWLVIFNPTMYKIDSTW